MSEATPPTDDPLRLAPHPVLSEYYADESQRKRRVRELFDASASHYDWITDAMSFGSGRWYRRDALLRTGLAPGMSLLDVGAGTGVIALHAQHIVGAQGCVVALDPSGGMLQQARRAGVVYTVPGCGEALPFPDASFDMLTMGYALRHVADLRATFSEYRRVLKPGGRLLLLEITRPPQGPRYWLLKAYLKWIVPLMARLFRRSREAQLLMRYYWDTIDQCVPPATILAALQAVGLGGARRHVVFGVFSEYTATKPAAEE